MNSAKRAGLYIIRHKLKSLILLAVLTIIATFVLTGIAIQSSAENAAADVRTSVSGKIRLAIDRSPANTREERYNYGNGNSAIAQIYSGDQITDEVVKTLQNIDGVTGYNSISSFFGGYAVDFEFIPGQFKISGDLCMTDAVIFSEKHDGFAAGTLSLKEGRHITDMDRNVIMISDELAKYNNLSLGDTMTYHNIDIDKDATFTIVGIFTGTEGQGENALIGSMIPSNQCIISYNDLFEFFDGFNEMLEGYNEVDFFVEDPINIQNVYDRIANDPQVKGKTFTLAIDTQEYDVIANPLESLQSLVSTLIIIISVVSVAILALLLTIWTRGRVRETGILMSIGVSKAKIVGQLILETVFVAILAFGLSYPASNVIADKAGELIMEQAADENSKFADSEDFAQLGSNVFDGSMFNDLLTGKQSTENAVKEIDVKIKPEHLIWVYAIGTILVVCAVLIASYTIIRLKPREILSKMS